MYWNITTSKNTPNRTNGNKYQDKYRQDKKNDNKDEIDGNIDTYNYLLVVEENETTGRKINERI